ncbi:ribokinase [Aspergillus melleus]|uniref:ribokinase n=1 Tax=Aspergillus melleus TaxID=138277 RepID=UPI001E8CA5ED|nr:putative ribokinase [Aspergillus melleus]KAH8432030.1 putative ribokinase [Aspergillus melleus]
MAPTIRVIGSLNVDMVSVTPRFPEAGETITSSSYFISAGGKGANQAVACGRLSRSKNDPSPPSGKSPVKVEMVGAVGGLDGHFDALLKPTLEKSGVDASRVQVIGDAYTGVAVIVVDESAGGENRIVFSPGANYQGMKPEPQVLGMGLAAPVPDVIVMQGEIPVDTTIGILRELAAFKVKNRAEGKRGIEVGPDVLFNPAPAPPGGLPEDVYAAVDHFVMNETEAGLMSPPAGQLLKVVPDAEGQPSNEKVARYFHQLGVTYVLITLGSKGVWYSATEAKTSGPVDGVNRFTNQLPAAKVSQVLDTTAAGDTFVGAYAVEVARWREQRRADGKVGQDVTTEEKPVRYQQVMNEALGLATRAAARGVERRGAMDSIPWEDEI